VKIYLVNTIIGFQNTNIYPKSHLEDYSFDFLGTIFAECRKRRAAVRHTEKLGRRRNGIIKSFAHGVTTGFSASRFGFFQEQQQQDLKDHWQTANAAGGAFCSSNFFFGVEMRAKCKNLSRIKKNQSKVQGAKTECVKIYAKIMRLI